MQLTLLVMIAVMLLHESGVSDSHRHKPTCILIKYFILMKLVGQNAMQNAC